MIKDGDDAARVKPMPKEESTNLEPVFSGWEKVLITVMFTLGATFTIVGAIDTFQWVISKL